MAMPARAGQCLWGRCSGGQRIGDAHSNTTCDCDARLIPNSSGQVDVPYHVPASMCESVEPPPWDNYGQELWLRIGSHVMLHTYLLEQQSTSAVEVMTIDASEPVLWQARALRQLPIEELTLIPFSPTALIPFKDGDKIKRPTTLHPSLPFHIVCETGAAHLGVSAKFIIKTPIGGKLGR